MRYPDSRAAVWRWSVGFLCLLVLAGCGDDNDDEDEPDNAHLSGLVLSTGTLDPEFDEDTTAYTAEVANDVDSITVTPTTVNAAATVAVNGTAVASGTASPPLALADGANTVSVVVTAENGTTQRTYTVEVTRRGPPSDIAALADLQLTVAPLDQIFDGDVMSYTASAGYLGASTRVVAVPEDEGATITVNGVEAEPGEPGDYVPLAPGDNTFDVVVTAEDGVETLTYSLTVTRGDSLAVQQEAYLKAFNTGGQDVFGSSLGLSGDTLALGAPAEASAATGVDGDEDDDSRVGAGAVYVFGRNGSTWMQDAYVKASNTGDFDGFGTAVALDGDLLAAAAPFEDSLDTGVDGDEDDDSGAEVGAVYLFSRDGMNVWSQSAYLKPSNSDPNDEFGIAVGVSRGRVIVGAHLEDGSEADVDGDDDDDGASGAGAAYVFGTDVDDDWEQQAYLKASNPDSGDNFGAAVALSGSLAAVGAPFEDGGASGVDGDDDDTLNASGAVYVFAANEAGEWSAEAYVKASNPDSGDAFGTAVALDGNLLAVGAPGEDSAAAGIDGDGDDDTLGAAGAVYVFERDAGGDWSQVAYVKASNPDSQDGFGSAVALHGNVLVVGAALENSADPGIDGDEDDDSALNAGAVYVFERDAGGDWVQIAYVKAANTEANDEFGTAVGFSGDSLGVGAPFEDGGDTGVNGDDADNSVFNAGAGYVVR